MDRKHGRRTTLHLTFLENNCATKKKKRNKTIKKILKKATAHFVFNNKMETLENREVKKKPHM